MAKIAVQSGNYSVYNMDPGIMNELLYNNNCFATSGGLGNFTNSGFKKAANLIGLSYTNGMEFNDSNVAKIISEIKNGTNKQYMIKGQNYDKEGNLIAGSFHFIPVNIEKTKSTGKLYVDNSCSSTPPRGNSKYALSQYQTMTYINTYTKYVNYLVGTTLSKCGNGIKGLYIYEFVPNGTPTYIESVKQEHVHETQPPSIEFHSNNTVGKTSDTWLYPAFKIQAPGYINSKITTVGYTVKTESGKEIYKFEETYNKGVNKDGEPYTYFGDRTDGKANMDLAKDVYNIKRNYLTDERIEPGQKYKVKGFVIYDGKRYESSEYTMSTTGSKPIDITTSWEAYSKEAKTGDTWIRPSIKCTMNVTTEKVSKVVMYIYNKDMSKQLLKVTESNLSLSGKYYYFTSYFYSNKKDTASNLTWEPSNAVTLCSGTTYKYKFVATVSGKDYESPVFEMSTTGTESHNWNSGSVTKQPTCTATGVKTYTCRTCGATKTESIVAKGHTPGTAATCTSPQKCTVCGTQLAPATGHKWNSGTVTKQPTCTADGVKTFTCSSCGTTRTESVARKGHTPGAEATCTSPQKCIDCGEQLAPPTGHNFDNGIIIKEPTCLEDGVKIFTCSSCGTTRTEPVYGRGHIRGEAATCTAPQTCTVCGTQLAPASGHNYSGSYYYSAHPHEEYQKCTRCNAEKKTGNTKKVDGCSICYPIVTFTITYNANGGTGEPSPQTKESGKALTLSSTEPTRQGYTFLGWATSSGASNVQYNAGSSFTVDANTTLYAVWRKDEVITSDVNFELSSANAVPGSTVELTLKVAGTTKVDLLTVYNILYDKSVLEFQGVSEYGDLVKKCALPDNAFDDSNMSFTMGYADSTTASGTIAVLKFKVKDNAPEKDIIISYEAVATKDRLPVESSVKTSVVSISKWLSGDFNEDGKINMKDAVYFIGWVGAPFLPQFQINHSFNADFNKDGKINMKDAVYFIGWVGAPFLPQFKIDW